MSFLSGKKIRKNSAIFHSIGHLLGYSGHSKLKQRNFSPNFDKSPLYAGPSYRDLKVAPLVFF